LNATLSPALAGTGFGLNDVAPTAELIVTVTVGPEEPGAGVEGEEGDDELPQPQVMMAAPARAIAVPDKSEERMSTSSQKVMRLDAF
jgi:hypothetical protein